MSGNLEKRLPMTPPLLLVETLKGEPEIVGEEGIIVDSWNCTIWEEHGDAIGGIGLEEALSSVMESLGFSRKGTRRLDAGRLERECREMRFVGARMRQ